MLDQLLSHVVRRGYSLSHPQSRMRRATRGTAVAVLAALAVTATTLTAVAGATPTAFTLAFTGAHTPATIPSNSGVQHEGPFTASSPLCSSGYAVDARFEGPIAVRRHNCDDGSGSFTARIDPAVAEHEGSGGWQIVEGTGAYEKLRGKGTFTGVHVSGDLASWPTIVYRTTWKGVVDFDDVGPEIAVSAATLRRLARPRGTHLLRIAFSARDGGGAVTYRLAATTAGTYVPLAARSGETNGETITFALRLRLHGARSVRIEIGASDPLGNERVLVRSVRVRS
jgi:hypothetical protein